MTPFKLHLAITGKLAPAIVETIKVPGATEINFVREQEIPLPRLWFDRAANEWKPEQWGGSIFDTSKGWSLDTLREWTRRYTPRFPGRPVILDIEDVHPFESTQSRDGYANHRQMRDDLAERYGYWEEAQRTDAINFALRQVWKVLLDGLKARGLDVSVYGHTPDENEPEPTRLRAGRSWFDSRLPRTHPVIYEWAPDRVARLHHSMVTLPRVRAATRLCPLAPCLPFVTPVLDDGDRRTMISPGHFYAMIVGAKALGAAGVVLWYHADDPSRLTPWLGVVDTYINRVLQEACS